MIFLGTLLSRTVVCKKSVIGAAGVESMDRRSEAYVPNQHLSSALTCDINHFASKIALALPVLLILAIPPVSRFWLLNPPRGRM